MAVEASPTNMQAAMFKKLFKNWLNEGCPENLNLLVTGKTGVGKSRFVNALVGHTVAREGREKDPCTSEVTSYRVVIEGITVTVWDSPGLEDGTTNEARYIRDMKRRIKDVALIIYCVKMDDTRFYDADQKAIRILTIEFGKKMWENTIVALTFANKVVDPDGEDELEYFQSQLKEWKKQFNKYFAAVGLNPKTCKWIPVLPVGNKIQSMRLPDRENWLSDMWIECYQVMKASARRGMHRINKDRLKLKSSSSIDRDMPCKFPSTYTQSVIKQWLFEERPENPDLNVLISGKTGVGKSRLVNALVGKKVAKEGQAKDPCTSRVACYQITIENVAVKVWDSPGLQDGTTNEARYIQDMKDNIKDIALMIYCVKMDEARFYDADKKAIRTLTDEFGKEVWNHAVVALTFANKVEDPDGEDGLEYFQSQLEEWKKQFDRYFASVGLNPEARSSIPVLPVGNKAKSMRLPDRGNWFSDLSIECCRILKLSPRFGRGNLQHFCVHCGRYSYWR